MGCGASSGGMVTGDDILDTSSLKESARRKKNNGQRHANLMNIIDESIDASRSFKTYAIQRRQPWDDWLKFAFNESENAGEAKLQEVVNALQANYSVEQAGADMQLVKDRNDYISVLKDMLGKMKMYDEHELANKNAVADRDNAQKEVEKATQKIEQAKQKPNYDLVQAKLEGALDDRKIKLAAAEERVKFTRTILEDQAVALKRDKHALTYQSLKLVNDAYIRYHRDSLQAAERYSGLIDQLAQQDVPSQNSAATRAPPEASEY